MTLLNYILLIISTFNEKSSQIMAFSTNHKYIHVFLYMVIFFCTTLFIYLVLYKRLNLKKNVVSFFAFSSFFLVFCLYLRSIYLMPYTCQKPFYIDNLQVLSYYRYLFSLCIVALFILLWVLNFYFLRLKYFIDVISYPYIKEEVRLFLYNWNERFMAPFCSYLYKKLYTSPLFYKLYFFVHFILYVF